VHYEFAMHRLQALLPWKLASTLPNILLNRYSVLAVQTSIPQDSLRFALSSCAIGTTCSLDVFDLRILRVALEFRSRCSLQVYVKESADVVRRHSDLAAAIDAHNA
jgi:hypothetical protein